jgi:hypothetical protein
VLLARKLLAVDIPKPVLWNPGKFRIVAVNNSFDFVAMQTARTGPSQAPQENVWRPDQDRPASSINLVLGIEQSLHDFLDLILTLSSVCGLKRPTLFEQEVTKLW